jgi:branched-chain amino acid transport system ATP-binding protein
MTLLAAENLSLSFGGVRAADKVSFAVAAGEVFTIIGPNGAGKTTVVNMVSRRLAPAAGRLTYAGRNLLGVAAHDIVRLGIARTFQNLELFEHATVMQNLLLGRHAHRTTNLFSELLFLPSVRAAERRHREKVEDVIDFLDLQRWRDAPVAMLPYGVRKVVELGRALATEPKLLLLDEPAAGLNPEETEDLAFWIEDMVADLGITILMVEHDLALVNEVSDRVLVMNQGQVIAEGTPEAVQREPAVIAAYLGS